LEVGAFGVRLGTAFVRAVRYIQAHDDDGSMAGRTLAANMANPRDLLYITMRNLEAAGA
jgi:hypothetical protein